MCFCPLKSAREKELIDFGKKIMGKCVGRGTKSTFSELLGTYIVKGYSQML